MSERMTDQELYDEYGKPCHPMSYDGASMREHLRGEQLAAARPLARELMKAMDHCETIQGCRNAARRIFALPEGGEE